MLRPRLVTRCYQRVSGKMGKIANVHGFETGLSVGVTLGGAVNVVTVAPPFPPAATLAAVAAQYP